MVSKEQAMAPMASEVLQREFLPLRGKLIEVAAALDRLARAEGSLADDPRMHQVRRSLEILSGTAQGADRAEQVQMAFSLPYEAGWRESFPTK
jgi:hypothetical protein